MDWLKAMADEEDLDYQWNPFSGGYEPINRYRVKEAPGMTGKQCNEDKPLETFDSLLN